MALPSKDRLVLSAISSLGSLNVLYSLFYRNSMTLNSLIYPQKKMYTNRLYSYSKAVEFFFCRQANNLQYICGLWIELSYLRVEVDALRVFDVAYKTCRECQIGCVRRPQYCP